VRNRVLTKRVLALTRRVALIVSGLAVLAGVAPGSIVTDVGSALAHGDLPRASEYILQYRLSRGTTPELIEALSWMARDALFRKDYAQAEKYAQETYSLSLAQLKGRQLDREPHLPLALGAAIEVEAGLLMARGQRADAIGYLNSQLKTYYATSIRTRIQKNINLLSLEGKRAPALERVSLPAGKPVLLFFWAHWCPDCKHQAPVLARLKAEFAAAGLVIVAPTQKYGYIGGGIDAPPDVETAYIEQVRRTYYASLIDAPAPVSEENFSRYGASTTPTLVLVDRAGIVRLYHPGEMSYQELRARITAVLNSSKS
jgi:thiol-disulfide isomerase/thioredoxin